MAYKISDDDSLTRIDDTDDNIKVAEVNTNQKKIILNKLKQGQSLQEIWDAAKQFDNLFWGKMTKEEFNAYVKEREKKDNTTYGTLAQADDEFADIEGYTARKIPGFETMSDEYSGGITDLDIKELPDVYSPDQDYGQFFRPQPVDEYMSPLKSFRESKTLAEYFKGRDISPTGIGQGVLQAYQLAKKQLPISWAFDAAQNLNLPDLRGGQTQRDYNINRNLNINRSRVGMRSDPRTLRNLQINYARQGLTPYQIEQKVQNFQNVTGQIADQTGDKEIITPAVTTPYVSPARPHDVSPVGGQGSVAESRDTGQPQTGGGGYERGDYGGRGYHWAEGGRVRFSEGGIVGLWRELSSL